MKTTNRRLSGFRCQWTFFSLLAWLGLTSQITRTFAAVQFAVTIPPGRTNPPTDGRLFVILSRAPQPEPRLLLGQTGSDAPLALARDATAFAAGQTMVLDRTVF